MARLRSRTGEKAPQLEARPRLPATVQTQCLIEERTQGVQPDNQVAALSSHASKEVIGKMLCRLKTRPSEQLIVTLGGYHDNGHACG